MKIDLTVKLTDFHGDEVVSLKDPNELMELGEALIHGLLFQEGGKLPAAEMLARWDLASLLQGKAEVDLTAQQVTDIRGYIADCFTVGIYGRLYHLLDG